MSDEDFVLNMKDCTAILIETSDKEGIFDDKLGRKFEIRKFIIQYSISKTRERKNKRIVLENNIKDFKEGLEKKTNTTKYIWTANGRYDMILIY